MSRLIGIKNVFAVVFSLGNITCEMTVCALALGDVVGRAHSDISSKLLVGVLEYESS